MGKDLKGKELGSGFTQRKDGLYQARYRDRFGKQKTIYDKKITNLRKEYAIAIAENETCISVREEIILDSWFKRWMNLYKEKSVRPNTIREYTHIYNKNISPYMGNRKICTFVKSDIQWLVDKAYEDNYKYERQSKIKIILSDMFGRALEDNLISKNPCKGVKIRSEKEIKARALTIDEQIIFFDFCRNTFYDNLFNVAINTGLRPGELFALTRNDIDLDKGFINVSKTLVYQKYLTDEKKTFHIEEPKTKQSYRKVPINSICKQYLEKQFELKQIVSTRRPKEQNDFIFVTRYNTPLNSVIYSDAIRSVIKTINSTRKLEDEFSFFSGHTFRHTFATRCFENGIQPKVVQSYLGHASLKMTMDLYTHVMEDKLSNDIEKIVPETKNKVINFQERTA